MIVEYETRDRTALIGLNRPEARNAINSEMAEAIEGAIDRLEADDAMWAGVLYSTGPVFCAGADLKAIAGGASDLGTERGGFAGIVRRDRNKPLIAALEGPAVAGGTEIVLSCDLVVAAVTARFGLPEVKRSLIAAAGGLYRLPRALPRNVAMELTLTGGDLDAATAHRHGLVNRLVLEDGGPGMDTDAARGGSIGNFTRPLAFDTLESASSWLQAQNPRLGTRSDEEMEKMVKHRMKENWAGRGIFRHDPELYWIVDDALGWFKEDGKQVWERLASISCPTLVLRGEESDLLSSEAAGQITAAIPNATLVEIPGAGHSIHSDAPDLFRDAVLGFLEENG